MINQVVLVGRLTRDPELKQTNSGKSVCSFDIAVNRMGEGADYPKIIAWEKQAENLVKYNKKGSLVGVVGRIQTRKYEHEGKNRQATEIVAFSIQFLDSKGTHEEDQAAKQEPSPSDFEDAAPDDLPF